MGYGRRARYAVGGAMTKTDRRRVVSAIRHGKELREAAVSVGLRGEPELRAAMAADAVLAADTYDAFIEWHRVWQAGGVRTVEGKAARRRHITRRLLAGRRVDAPTQGLPLGVAHLDLRTMDDTGYRPPREWLALGDDGLPVGLKDSPAFVAVVRGLVAGVVDGWVEALEAGGEEAVDAFLVALRKDEPARFRWLRLCVDVPGAWLDALNGRVRAARTRWRLREAAEMREKVEVLSIQQAALGEGVGRREARGWLRKAPCPGALERLFRVAEGSELVHTPRTNAEAARLLRWAYRHTGRKVKPLRKAVIRATPGWAAVEALLKKNAALSRA